MRKSFKITVSGAVLAFAAMAATATAASADTATPPTVTRIQGSDRYETAVRVSQALVAEPSSFQVVYVASGQNFPDALAAAPATQGWSSPAPLLLVPKDGSIPTVVTTELDRLKPSAIYVVGGGAAVSDVMLGQLRKWDDNPTRLSGSTRYGTAATVAEISSGGSGGTVFLATGLNYPDALAGAAVAARTKSSLVLTNPTSLPSETSDALKYFLKPSRVVILGSTDVVSDAVVNQVKAAVPGVEVQRIGGATRYETAALVSKYGYPSTAPGALLSTGDNFPDALAGGPLAAATGQPLLLTRPGCAPAPTLGEFTRLQGATVTALGGANVVSDAAAGMTSC